MTVRNNQPSPFAVRSFSMADQEAFAKLSGDTNPVHMDPVAARRTVVGAPIVHGVHMVLWALDALARSDTRPDGVRKIDVRFTKAAYLGDEIHLSPLSVVRTVPQMRLTCGAKIIAIISLEVGEAPAISDDAGAGHPLVPAGLPRSVDFDAAIGICGTIPFAASAATFAASFPAAAVLIGATRLRGLAACSRLVGMDCPGERSIFARLTVEFTEDGADNGLSFQADGTDTRFRLVHMTVVGAGLKGRADAFAPVAPTRQLTMIEAARQLPPMVFAGQTALVVGGSRGLGETAAKLIAAGGGKVLVTYAVGREDAERVAAEIVAHGGEAKAYLYNVTKAAASQVEAIASHRPTHLYYFATGRISRAKLASFEPDLFDSFMTCYGVGLYDLCAALRQAASAPLSIFYPSSVFVEERPKEMTEYAMAKAAGEVMCEDLPSMLANDRVVIRRLPKILTDQTAGITDSDLPSPVETILPILLEMGRSAS